ncbi:hypothetical protein WICMUC_005690 [Wickerhamomyces mucosus]|uniref:Mitochondrial fusion and transport protein UGO1 n=1 Tax=Wickerhamomyces mucosus TaxID=1378264 RepID=A0A9P8P6V9_9ASCO|nr:hypothetical protein WICMUC_005690 [Wickerhamomyces mucosus]
MSELRPYYDPETFNTGNTTVFRPGVGVIDENGVTIASKISRGSGSKFNSLAGLGLSNSYRGESSSRSIKNLIKLNNYNANIKKNIYSDLEFHEYFEWNNVGELLKSLFNSFLKNYINTLISQPFEVSRLLLQVGDFKTKIGNQSRQTDNVTGNFKKKNYRNIYNGNENNDTNDNDNVNDNDDEDDEELNYFESREAEFKRTRTIRQQSTKLDVPKDFKLHKKSKKYLVPVSLNTVDIMSSLLSTEGIRGLWRASNCTFIFTALSSTLEAWITGFLSPFFQIPDPFFVDVAHSSDPTTTLILSLSASIITGLLLAPLDLIRTRLIVTKVDNTERSFRNSIKNLNFYTIPISLIIPTILNSLANKFLKKFTPYLLFIKFGIESYGSPTIYSTISLISSILELFIKLPIETLLRRAQVSYLLKNSSNSNNCLKIKDADNELIVKFAGYSGVFTTLYDIFYNDGENRGLEAIFRGWRVGLLNILGSWGLEILQISYDDQSFQEEKF